MLLLLRNEWKARLRAAFSGKDKAIRILLGLFAGYMLLNILSLGFFLPELIKDANPDAAIWYEANKLLFYYFLFDFFLRFLMQSFPLFAVQPYLLLPVNRRNIYHFILLRSLPNFFNLLPLVLTVPFALRTVRAELGGGAALLWLLLVVLISLFNHYLVFYVKRLFTVKPLLSLGMLLLVGSVFYLDISGKLALSGAFANGVDTLVIAQPAGLLLVGAVVAALYFLLFKRFQRYAYLDAMIPGKGKSVSTQQFSWLDRFGKIGELIRLDMKLIWRNKRPRTMLLMGVLFIFYPLIFTDLLAESFGWAIFIGIFVSGILMVQYGQFMLSWESSFFDFLLTQRFSMREYYEAKFYFFAFSILLFTLLTQVYGFIDSRLPLVFIACAFFNVGINSFVMMYASTFNVKAIDLNKGAFFNYEGVGASQFIIALPILLIPLFLYLPFGMLGYRMLGVAFLGVLGILGIIFRERFLDIIMKKFNDRRYAISSGFKA